MKYKPPITFSSYKERNREIRRLRRQRYTLKELASMFGINHQRVSVICRGVDKKRLT